MSRSPSRIAIVVAVLLLWAGIVVLRLAEIQILRYSDFVARAARQQERTVSLNPTRGSILDRNQRALARSVPGVSVYADPQGIRDPGAVANQLAAIPELGVRADELMRRLTGKGEFAWIARQLDASVEAKVRALEIEGIYFLQEQRRTYPKGSLAANLIGFVSVDGEGLAGVEHASDRWTRGKPGKVTILRDARRGMYLVGGEGANAGSDGLDVVLTIDEVLQHAAERALADAVVRSRARSGTVVVMDPHDGAVLAMASWPTFDPNRFSKYSGEHWRNRVVQDLYEPGSTFKIVTAAAGLEERLVTPSQLIDCGDGSIEIATVKIRETDGKRYGLLPFEDVMALSSNVGTIRVALALGEQRLYQYVRKFGFGEKTGVDLPGEAAGILRRPVRWSRLSNAVIAIGQEIAVTPLQMTRAVAMVANGGLRVDPYLIDRVVDRDGNVVWRREKRNGERVISERTAAILNEMLKTVVARGTGQAAALPEHVVAGKTGTAQKAVRGGYAPDITVASFAGYVPADRPRAVILVVIDEPESEQSGGKAAAPVFREIAETVLRSMGVPPSVPRRQLRVDPRVRLAEFSQAPRGVSPASPAGSLSDRVVIPDLRGLDARAAIALATASGFEVRAQGSGIVTAQSPDPGASAQRVPELSLVLESHLEELP